MRELKPCPFCGGEATMFCDESTDTWNVLCDNVPCPAEPGTAICFSEQEAIEAWNTRAERTCHVVPHGYCIANGEETSCRCWSCSECSYGWHISDYDRQYRYCPNCGAKVVE